MFPSPVHPDIVFFVCTYLCSPTHCLFLFLHTCVHVVFACYFCFLPWLFGVFSQCPFWYTNCFQAEAVGTSSMNLAISVMYSEGFFIRCERALKVAKLWLLFLQKYSLASLLVYRKGLNRFATIPKLHMLHHGCMRLLREAQQAQRNSTIWTLNPLSESVQMQEDWIGRPSRLSRRVCPKLVHLRVCQRLLISTMHHLKRADVDQRGIFSLQGAWVPIRVAFCQKQTFSHLKLFALTKFLLGELLSIYHLLLRN